MCICIDSTTAVNNDSGIKALILTVKIFKIQKAPHKLAGPTSISFIRSESPWWLPRWSRWLKIVRTLLPKRARSYFRTIRPPNPTRVGFSAKRQSVWRAEKNISADWSPATCPRTHGHRELRSSCLGLLPAVVRAEDLENFLKLSSSAHLILRFLSGKARFCVAGLPHPIYYYTLF